VPAGDTELDFDAGLGGVLASLYSPDLWPLAIEGLHEVQQGRGDQLLQLATGIAGIADEGQSSNLTDASIAINCVDEDLLDADGLAQLREDTYSQVPIMDPGTAADEPTRDKCADFPVTGELGIPYAQDIEGLPSTLVISLTGDAATPYEGAVELAKTLDGTLLTVQGEGHTVIGKGMSPCADAIAATYLLDLVLPENAPELTCAVNQ
jgi:hypothetical protein